MTRFRCVLVALALLIGALRPGMVGAQAACQFQLGFAALQALIPTIVGGCLDNEAYAVTGDSVQHTTNGLLVWRKLDNWTAFTDGYRTWVNGPHGLQQRLNTQRFAWEVNPQGLPLAPGGTSGIEGVVTLGPTMPVCQLQTPCSRPISATIAIDAAAGQHLLQVTAGADGYFQVTLTPGTYTLLPLPLQAGALYPRAIPTTITVVAGTYTSAAVAYDTGIR